MALHLQALFAYGAEHKKAQNCDLVRMVEQFYKGLKIADDDAAASSPFSWPKQLQWEPNGALSKLFGSN